MDKEKNDKSRKKVLLYILRVPGKAFLRKTSNGRVRGKYKRALVDAPELTSRVTASNELSCLVHSPGRGKISRHFHEWLIVYGAGAGRIRKKRGGGGGERRGPPLNLKKKSSRKRGPRESSVTEGEGSNGL